MNSRMIRENPIDLKDYMVIESSDFQWANADGSITVPAGQEETLVEYEPLNEDNRIFLHALGASNASDVEFRLRYGENISFTTESSIGSINDPFSFTDKLGAPLTSQATVKYTAINSSDADVNLAGRMHLEVE